ncbi:hypothetical protein CVT26_013996 [Gymnopilus dilepis]|uniref:Uncharacterized protein n=1 Tax=Gymnopilus dilepis TaxID=231916 RepID=A0A409VW63_9AGAR|nr:hypothetical protein CVT26_013996 [Gymnopilus dilepis]
MEWQVFVFKPIAAASDPSFPGGNPPFQLLVVPVFGAPVNISIPSSAFNNGAGSYSFQLPVANGSQVVFVMSDASGFNSAVASDILTVGPSKGGSCNTHTSVDFSFQLNTALQQCRQKHLLRPYVFNGYDGAVQPVTIGAIIPGGTVFTLNPPTGPASFTWNANVARGTSLIFFMTDSKGRQGGSSDVKFVGTSDDSSCLNANSPTSTGGPPSPSATSSSSPSASSSASPTPSTPSHSGVSIGAIAGTVIGGLLFLAVVITLGLFFLKKRQDASGQTRRHSRLGGPGIDPPYQPPMNVNAPPPGYPSAGNVPYGAYPPPSSVATASNPFLDAAPSQYDSRSQYSVPYQPSESSYQTRDGYQAVSYQPSEANTYQTTPQSQGYPPRQVFPPPNPFDASSPSMVPRAESESLAPQGRHQSSSSRDSMTSTYLPYQRSEASYQTRDTYQPPPPAPGYASRQPYPPPDPFNTSAPPMVPGTEFESLATQSRDDSSSSRDSMTPSQRKAALAANAARYAPPTRFILHTDVEDAMPPDENGIVELPPQYSERRGPPPDAWDPSQPPPDAGHPHASGSRYPS